LIRYLTLAEFFLLAEEATGVEANTLIAVSRIELADSALHAPSAEFAGREFYPEAHDKGRGVSFPACPQPSPTGRQQASCLVVVGNVH
jgi:death-on-curing protein